MSTSQPLPYHEACAHLEEARADDARLAEEEKLLAPGHGEPRWPRRCPAVLRLAKPNALFKFFVP
jgi:hypothetical protein